MNEKNKNRRRKPNEHSRNAASNNQKPVKKQSRNREFARITYIFVGLFLVLMGYIVYFNIARSNEILLSSYNTRQDSRTARTTRGSIYASDGTTVLAETVADGKKEVRNYPYGSAFAHIVGYHVNGRSGLESLGNSYLMESNINFKDKILNELKDEKNPGDSVVSTLDASLQQFAYNAFGANRGAVVALEPSTGKVLAMISKPDYDPNTVADQWEALINDNENSSLYNRAAQGQYAPGSTFKIVSGLAYIREHADYENYSHTCTGSIKYGDLTIKCYDGAVHGTVNMQQSYEKSCNTSFINMMMNTSASGFRQTAEDLLFNSSLPYAMESTVSNFPVDSSSPMGQIMMSAIGQAEVTASPLHMAMIAAAIGNNGIAMTPYTIERVVSDDGEVIESFTPEQYKQIMSAEEAGILYNYLSQVAIRGTASALNTDRYEVIGKTGTAEYNNSDGKTHAWFVGYANNGEKDIAIAVIAEGAGTGSAVSVPIAKAILDFYLNE